MTPAVTVQRNAAPPGTPLSTAKSTLRITVLMGGPGCERQVSLESGRAVADALESLGHRVHRADIGPDDLGSLDRDADVVFIALHGEFGEDGKLQHILDERGIRYVGSGARASELAMDKVRTKRVLAEAGIHSPRHQLVQAGQGKSAICCFDLPAVVKPVRGGSSVDITVAQHPVQLIAAVEHLTEKESECMVEEFVSGPELTVGIVGDRALDPLWIRTKRGFYDYQAKYGDNDTEYLFDIDLPATMLDDIRGLSLRALQVLGCRDFSRVDWIVDEGSGRAHCLEVNTIPGFTSHSLLPKMAARAGLDFSGLCQHLVDLAIRR